MADTVRVGIIGAGANTRKMHIPKLKAIAGVEIVGVVNRSSASSKRAASEFGIPNTYDTWEDLVEDEQIDAVVIGTWPYLHAEATVAALLSGKHVLTEARMAMNLTEAQTMLSVAQAESHLTTQIVPSPSGLACDNWMRENLAVGVIGEVREIEIRSVTPGLVDPTTPHNWRTQSRYSGLNTMTLGIHHEAVQRWFGDTASVVASARTFTANRPDPETGRPEPTRVPESLTVASNLVNGAHAAYRVSNVGHHAGPDTMTIFGTTGTLRVELWTGAVSHAPANAAPGPDAFAPVEIPADQIRHWTCEREFIDAIRGDGPVQLTTFEDGVRYMAFTEAVIESARTGERCYPMGY